MKVAGSLLIDEVLQELCSCNSEVYKGRVAGGVETIMDAATSSRRWKLISSSDGEISIVENRRIAQDYSANAAYFALHTDGLHYESPPQFAMLHCENAGTLSVPTFFLDTTRLLERLSRRDREAVEVLRRLDQVFIGRGGRECRRPMIEINPLDSAEVMNITFGRAYLRPARHVDGTGDEPHQAETVAAFQRVLQQVEEMGLSTHDWSSGDLIAWDNHRFVHGRGNAVGSEGRRLIRAWLSPKEFRSQSSGRPSIKPTGTC